MKSIVAIFMATTLLAFAADAANSAATACVRNRDNLNDDFTLDGNAADADSLRVLRHAM